jgi:hypothetical protein
MAAIGSESASRTWSWKSSRCSAVIARHASIVGTVGSGTCGSVFLLGVVLAMVGR